MTEAIPWATDQDLEEHDQALVDVKKAQAFSAAVDDQVRALRIRDRARERYEAEKAATIVVPPFDAGTLHEIRQRPRPPKARVEELIPYNAGTLVVAQRKTGKTTFQLNLARTLIEGSEFLGKFPVRPIDGNVAILNFEVSAHQLADWATEHQIPSDRLYLVNLRGRRNPFTNDDDRARLISDLRGHDIESLIVDPFGRAYTGKSQNDPGEVGAWLADLDRFAREDGAGALDVILAAHAGWDGERTRGSTALEDWADSIITLVRDKDDDQQRYLRAEGRDVLIDEDQLLFDDRTRTLTLAGAGSRRNNARVRKLEAQIPVVLDLLREHPSMTGNQLDIALAKTDLPHSKGDGTKAAQLAERRGLLGSKDGSRRSRLFFLLTTSPTSPNSPQGDSDDFPHLPDRGEVVQGTQTTHLPDNHNPGKTP